MSRRNGKPRLIITASALLGALLTGPVHADNAADPQVMSVWQACVMAGSTLKAAPSWGMSPGGAGSCFASEVVLKDGPATQKRVHSGDICDAGAHADRSADVQKLADNNPDLIKSIGDGLGDGPSAIVQEALRMQKNKECKGTPAKSATDGIAAPTAFDGCFVALMAAADKGATSFSKDDIIAARKAFDAKFADYKAGAGAPGLADYRDQVTKSATQSLLDKEGSTAGSVFDNVRKEMKGVLNAQMNDLLNRLGQTDTQQRNMILDSFAHLQKSIDAVKLDNSQGEALCVKGMHNTMFIRNGDKAGTIVMCPATLMGDSKAEMAQSLATALGRAIDSCSLDGMQMGQPPMPMSELFEPLRVCLAKQSLKRGDKYESTFLPDLSPVAASDPDNKSKFDTTLAGALKQFATQGKSAPHCPAPVTAGTADNHSASGAVDAGGANPTTRDTSNDAMARYFSALTIRRYKANTCNTIRKGLQSDDTDTALKADKQIQSEMDKSSASGPMACSSKIKEGFASAKAYATAAGPITFDPSGNDQAPTPPAPPAAPPVAKTDDKPADPAQTADKPSDPGQKAPDTTAAPVTPELPAADVHVSATFGPMAGDTRLTSLFPRNLATEIPESYSKYMGEKADEYQKAYDAAMAHCQTQCGSAKTGNTDKELEFTFACSCDANGKPSLQVKSGPQAPQELNLHRVRDQDWARAADWLGMIKSPAAGKAIQDSCNSMDWNRLKPGADRNFGNGNADLNRFEKLAMGMCGSTTFGPKTFNDPSPHTTNEAGYFSKAPLPYTCQVSCDCGGLNQFDQKFKASGSSLGTYVQKNPMPCGMPAPVLGKGLNIDLDSSRVPASQGQTAAPTVPATQADAALLGDAQEMCKQVADNNKVAQGAPCCEIKYEAVVPTDGKNVTFQCEGSCPWDPKDSKHCKAGAALTDSIQVVKPTAPAPQSGGGATGGKDSAGTASKPADPAAKPTDKPGDKAADKAADKPADQSADNAGKQPGGDAKPAPVVTIGAAGSGGAKGGSIQLVGTDSSSGAPRALKSGDGLVPQPGNGFGYVKNATFLKLSDDKKKAVADAVGKACGSTPSNLASSESFKFFQSSCKSKGSADGSYPVYSDWGPTSEPTVSYQCGMSCTCTGGKAAASGCQPISGEKAFNLAENPAAAPAAPVANPSPVVPGAPLPPGIRVQVSAPAPVPLTRGTTIALTPSSGSKSLDLQEVQRRDDAHKALVDAATSACSKTDKSQVAGSAGFTYFKSSCALGGGQGQYSVYSDPMTTTDPGITYQCAMSCTCGAGNKADPSQCQPAKATGLVPNVMLLQQPASTPLVPAPPVTAPKSTRGAAFAPPAGYRVADVSKPDDKTAVASFVSDVTAACASAKGSLAGSDQLKKTMASCGPTPRGKGGRSSSLPATAARPVFTNWIVNSDKNYSYQCGFSCTCDGLNGSGVASCSPTQADAQSAAGDFHPYQIAVPSAPGS